MRQVRHFTIVAVLLVLAGTVMGKTLHVPTADYPTIQAAIDAAASGDKIKVAPGTYAENINFLGKAVRLYSSSGDPANTTIQGTGSTPVVTCANGETSATVLEGFTVTRSSEGYPYDLGSGMFDDNSSPTIINCTFSGNYAYFGGGMSNNHSSPTLMNCTFSGNRAEVVGGGMYNESGSSPTLTDCTFSGNIGSSEGGGMYNEASSPTLTNCTFSGNLVNSNGGGMLNNSSNPTLTNCTFTDNLADFGSGGGMLNNSSSPAVTNCTFSGNSADVGGGGMLNSSSSPTVTNCIFSGNGGGLDWGGAGMYNDSSSNPTVTNCTFSGNGPENGGGGMHNDGSSPTVTNCIFWSDIGGEIDGSATVTYSDVQGSFAGTGNIDADPLFVNAQGGDFHLAAGSPCIDAGTNSPAGGLPATDIEGNRRPVDGDGDRVAVADMGACEASKLRGPRK